MEMIHMMLYEEESKGLAGREDGPRAVMWHVAELKETVQVPPLPTRSYLFYLSFNIDLDKLW